MLGYVLVGNDIESELYVRMKKKACDKIGIEYIGHSLDKSVSQEQLSHYVQELQNNQRINGILVQLPLPDHINENQILDIISPLKDVDGICPYNIGLALKKRVPYYTSCTPLGVLKLIQSVCPDLKGKRVTVCGRSNIVGLPLSLLLNKQDATVSICHSLTPNIQDYIKNADIVVTAVGDPKFFKGEWFKEGAIAIDVGINQIQGKNMNGEIVKRIVGDIDFDNAIERCSYITPVPGGVGPMTIAMLMNNIVESWERMNF
ncbi:bifunctional protein [Stylonychia lemnae]|uniref:Bifunctional protein n=1 Tax=Stylonychia lemnae TaxID=5949 RepID=A0A078B6A6_STYLE|nr:bifunctional protein [Stylonychia lemnae]|eukprot:CDW89889.1 bifunctional protein [Stylonychia lemnae]